MRLRRVLCCALALLALVWVTPASAQEGRVHRVSRGQTLGRIAKRYGVSIGALCEANDITPKHKIKAGEELRIPSTTSPKERPKQPLKEPKKPANKGPEKAKWHTVSKGQRLGGIARRYGVEIEALCAANDIAEDSPIRPGQKLIVPSRDDPDGALARRLRIAKEKEIDLGVPVRGKPKSDSWRKYARPARRRGHVTLVRGGLRFEGYVIDARGRVLPKAKQAFVELLATRSGKQLSIDPRLIQLVSKVSDTFGSRPIEVVSGYRVERAGPGSRHRKGRAIDFRISGVPNSALRDYLQTLDDVGVGYYPQSSFVHLDVREQWTYWVDHSGPGEPARYGGFWTRPAR
jgi:LysM repeat protein